MVASPPSVRHAEYSRRRSPPLQRSRSGDPWSPPSHCATPMSRPSASASPSSCSVPCHRSHRVRGSYHTYDGLGHTLYGCTELLGLVGRRPVAILTYHGLFSSADDLKGNEARPLTMFVGGIRAAPTVFN